MSSSIYKRYFRGFTLLEIFVVIAIIGAIVLIATPYLLGMLQNYNVKTAATQLAIHLRFARNQCATQKIIYRVIINNKLASANQNTYTVEYSPFGAFTPLPDVGFKLPPGIEIQDSTVFSSGVATIMFNTRGGATSLFGASPYELSMSTRNGTTYRIRIQLTGEVEVAQTAG